MLTVLGFLVGIGLSLRNSTAYERYSEGRRYWSNLTLQTTNLARLIWVDVKERDGEQGKEDLLGKMYEMCYELATNEANVD
jgi:putative membrane protein